MTKEGEFVKIRAVGDICLGEHPFCIGWGLRTAIRRSDISFPFEFVRSILCDGDIVFANLEGPVSDSETSETEIGGRIFIGDRKGVEALKLAGFNIVSVANNHIFQHGVHCFQETLRILSLNSISAAGINKNRHTIPNVMNVRGIRCGILAYSTVPDCFSENDLTGLPSNPVLMISEIRNLKKVVDRVIVSCHWGLELMSRPEKKTRVLAQAMVEAGADIVIGHHPHVLQGVEEYRGSLIFYSLGNFFVDFIWSPEMRHSVIAEIQMPLSGKIDYRLIPVTIDEKYRPMITCDPEKWWWQRYMPTIDGITKSSLPLDEWIESNRANLKAKLNQIYKIMFLLRNWNRLDPITKRFVRDKIRGCV